MAYFSRRNEYVTEYSGHEEATKPLRDRILSVIKKYVEVNFVSNGDDDPWSIDLDDFIHETHKEFPIKDPFVIIQ